MFLRLDGRPTELMTYRSVRPEAADPSVAALVGNARLVTVAGMWSKDDAVAFAARLIETINQ